MNHLVETLPWDSAFFRRRLAHLHASRLTDTVARRALAICKRKKIEGLYFLSPWEHASIVCAERFGFHPVDTRVTLACKIPNSTRLSRPKPPWHLRPAAIKDIPLLRRHARKLFPTSRFSVDPHFPPQGGARLFAEWVAKSVTGQFDDCVWIAERRGQIAGFVSCRLRERYSGSIGLLGVFPAFQRKGVGQLLVTQAMRWMAQYGRRHVEVVTQAVNSAARQFYESCGFRVKQTALWYHWWAKK